jgi:hypothetical protein
MEFIVGKPNFPGTHTCRFLLPPSSQFSRLLKRKLFVLPGMENL